MLLQRVNHQIGSVLEHECFFPAQRASTRSGLTGDSVCQTLDTFLLENPEFVQGAYVFKSPSNERTTFIVQVGPST